MLTSFLSPSGVNSEIAIDFNIDRVKIIATKLQRDVNRSNMYNCISVPPKLGLLLGYAITLGSQRGGTYFEKG